jgi:hypothetical protein
LKRKAASRIAHRPDEWGSWCLKSASVMEVSTSMIPPKISFVRVLYKEYSDV